MKMQESPKSLANYFALSAAGAAISGWKEFSENPVLGVAAFGFVVAYAYLATRLAELLKVSSARILWIINTASVVLVFALALSAYSRDPTGAVVDIIGLLVNWYLLHNVKRLAAEAKAAAVSVGQAPRVK